MKKQINFKVILTVLVIIILVWFIWGYDVFGVRTLVSEGFDKIKGLSSNVNIEIKCPEGIIPSEIDLMKDDYGLSGYELEEVDFIYRWKPKWEDGQEMEIYSPPSDYEGVQTIDLSKRHCIKGSLEGQNVNYYYCDVTYSKTTTDISDEGEIGETGTISYRIKLILEQQEQIRTIRSISIDRYKVISSNCMKD